MTNTGSYDERSDLEAQYFQQLFDGLSPEDRANPDTPAIINALIAQDLGDDTPMPIGQPDSGLFDMLGLGATSPGLLQDVVVSGGVVNYDDQLTSDRILSTADLYYQYMNERIGVFQVLWKLQELFRAGTLRISGGPGAFGLYRFDKHAILRYRQLDRMRAYRRVLGYTNVPAGPGARTNADFHALFTHFIAEVAKFWRDKRISEVIRHNATDPTFGSVAIVRRAGLDLRNNVKNSSYGYVNVLRVETSQALDEAFKVLDASDLKAQLGAEDPWDLIELVMWQYFGRTVQASTMNRMAVAGRDILRWLAENYVLQQDRSAFESALYQIGETAEEWISSEHGLRMTRPTPPPRGVYQGAPPPAVSSPAPPPVAVMRGVPRRPRMRPAPTGGLSARRVQPRSRASSVSRNTWRP
jgi:hypothetical protein